MVGIASGSTHPTRVQHALVSTEGQSGVGPLHRAHQKTTPHASQENTDDQNEKARFSADLDGLSRRIRSVAILPGNPVINAEILARTDKEQGQQHDEVGGRKFDTVVEDDEFP